MHQQKTNSTTSMGLFSKGVLKTGVFFLLMLLWSFGTASAQFSDDPARLSLDLSGGTMLGDADFLSPFSGSLDVTAQTFNPVFQAGLRYSVSPYLAFSIVTGGFRLQASGAEPAGLQYSSDVITGRVSAQAAVLRVLGMHSTRLSQYLHAGYGVMQADVDPGEGFSSYSASIWDFSYGAGLRIRLSDRIDAFGEYSYHRLGDSRIDGVEVGNDRLGRISAGISLNFGTSERRHMAWYPPPSEIFVSRAELELMQALMREQENELARRDREFARLEQEVAQLAQRDYRPEIEELRMSAKELRQQIDGVKVRLDSLSASFVTGITVADQRSGIVHVRSSRTPIARPPRGFYVQVFASNVRSYTDQAFDRTRNHFADEPELAAMVLVRPFGGTQQVLIGPFRRVEDARAILGRARQLHSDAFIREIQTQ